MEWLSGWLKTVITIILLATFVDLLLPSTKLQRYVKTVMSLFILLALLSPVMQLLQRNWNVDQLLSRAEKKRKKLQSLQEEKGENSNRWRKCFNREKGFRNKDSGIRYSWWKRNLRRYSGKIFKTKQTGKLRR
ncbi:stage III sporulation protein AF [Paenibacillus larvae]|nr:stage III sporulation protein AF [Paenibacillus larvae]MDT2265204.1 stage III sporulation protein AF [Paenibacillus larvae]